MKKLIILLLIGSASSFVSAQNDNAFLITAGLKFGVCSSDAMYYSTKGYPNIFDQTRSGTTGVDQVYADRFNYWGFQMHLESYTKSGYFYLGCPGVFDWLTAFLFDWPNKPFRTGRLKDFSTNFPQGTKEQNLGGVYTDVLDARVAGGFSFGSNLNFAIKAGLQGGFGLQASVANFDEQTGATFANAPGYRRYGGGNLNLIISKDPKQGFLWRNTIMYNWYSGKANSFKLPGTGFKFESVATLMGILSVGGYFQTTTMHGLLAEPWLYGENVAVMPRAVYTNFGFTIGAGIVTGQ